MLAGDDFVDRVFAGDIKISTTLVDVFVTSFLDGAFDSPPSPPESILAGEILLAGSSFEAPICGSDNLQGVSHALFGHPGIELVEDA